jgi:hypothetical protein
MKKSISTRKQRVSLLAILTLVFSVLVSTNATPANAAVLWFDSLTDTDSDYGVGYYADISSVAIGTYDTDPDNMTFLIFPYNDTSLSFFVSGFGALSFDTNGDSVDDFVAYAPRTSLSAFSSSTRQIVTGANTPISCSSSWSMTSDYGEYAVTIPWRCLGMPSQFRVEVWLSNSVGFDYLDYGRTLYPVFAAPPTTTTTTTTTLPPYVPPVVTPPPYVAPPATLPLVAQANTSTPGIVDDWVDYLIVKNPVSITALLNTTNCCYGVRTGTRTMTVLSKSRGSCVVRGKRLYPMKKGTCFVKLSTGKGKTAKSETLKLAVRKK